MSTEENLKEAFAGESKANRTYLAFAKKAEQEGYPNIARLFRAAADSETIHALYHFQVMGMVNGTKENLSVAQGGENYEHTDMYPKFIEEAMAEDNKDAALGFRLASRVEEIHETKFHGAETALDSGHDLPGRRMYVCQYCGNVEEGEVPERCPVCGMSASMFSEVQ